ncbi:MAG: DNA cytosine methyltransferase [Merdibacter sp.]
MNWSERKPVKTGGTTFRKFIGQLRDLGYEVEWRELAAADYGAPTSRKRFVPIARCDRASVARHARGWRNREGGRRNRGAARKIID